MSQRERDALSVLEDAKAEAIPRIVENLRRSASELVAQPAMSSRVPPEERRRQWAFRLTETRDALAAGEPEREGSLGALIRQEQQKWGLESSQVPITILDYISAMTKESGAS